MSDINDYCWIKPNSKPFPDCCVHWDGILEVEGVVSCLLEVNGLGYILKNALRVEIYALYIGYMAVPVKMRA